MQVDSIDRELIDYLHEIAPGMHIASRPARGNRKEIHRWRVGGNKARLLAIQVAPFMRIRRKREMAERFMRW